ncbi:MAG: SAM-dependent chlorinase/fluorinase [Bacteroidia bacterium]
MPPTSIVLLTDFGTRDGYAGVMKGVIRGIAPGADIIDLSHEIGPQDLHAARFVLWNSYRYFPAGSIFVCVVDPGVGTARPIVALRTAQHVFLAPDNGLLDYVLTETPAQLMLRVENPRVIRHEQSNTFHGRDIFAPAAAHLAAGFPFTQLGPIHGYRLPEPVFGEVPGTGAFTARVIHTDYYGNLITHLRVAPGWRGWVEAGGHRISCLHTYAEAGPGTLLALRGSHGLLEVALRDGSAAQHLGMGYGGVFSGGNG